jgi:methylenetetrahydrofolate dehydrogenase (NADP+)/methenyltetrahydrofolate cyclohydrolase/formyltetrahydrofolate synthetase
VVTDLLDGKFKQVKWASFGGDHLNSYFIAYKMLDGSPAYRVGKAVPSTLRPFLNNAQASPEIASNLRVQLGSNRSWIAWAGSLWACQKVPLALEASLCQLSSEHCKDENGSRGTLKTGSITNVAWHESGSYYVRSGEHIWNFESASIRLGWDTLWDGLKHTLQDEPTDLAVRLDIL